MHFIDVCEIVQFVEASRFDKCALKDISPLCGEHFLSAEVSPEIMKVKINPVFWTQKRCPSPLNRGDSSC